MSKIAQAYDYDNGITRDMGWWVWRMIKVADTTADEG